MDDDPPDGPGALAALARAAAAEPDVPGHHANLGVALHARGRYDEAVAAHRRALAAVLGQLAAIEFNLGASLAAAGHLDRAADHFRAALVAAPTLVIAEQGLGVVLTELGQLDDALAAYRRAGALDPALADVDATLAVLLLRTGAVEAALVAAERACVATPDEAGAHGIRGSALARLGRHADAAVAYARARALAPTRVEVHFNCALGAEALGDLAGAVAAYHAAVACDPRHALSLINLSRVLIDLGRTDELLPIYEQLLAVDPDSTMMPHLLAGLRGETTAAAPRAYVVDLFDSIAPRFEELLVGRLHYRVPELLRAVLDRIEPGRRFAAALDLGCGTGLNGAALRPVVATLHGVDLAPRMVELARGKGLYDQLAVADVVDFLDGATTSYELIAAADVVIYLGDLAPLFAAARRRLVPGGLFAASVERLDDDEAAEVRLRPTGRYAHRRRYLERLAVDHGFDVVACDPIAVRHEADGVVAGWLFVLSARP